MDYGTTYWLIWSAVLSGSVSEWTRARTINMPWLLMFRLSSEPMLLNPLKTSKARSG